MSSTRDQSGSAAERPRRYFEMAADWQLAAVNDDPRCSAGDRWFEFTGTGHNAELGRCTLYAAHCTRSAPDLPTSWYDGTWSMTTEAGDVVNITFEGMLLEPGRAAAGIDHMIVVGGTGRFGGATGEMYGELVPDWSQMPKLALHERIHGWISY